MRSHARKLAASRFDPRLVMITACKTTQSPGEPWGDTKIHAQVRAKLTTGRFSNVTNIDVNGANGMVPSRARSRTNRARPRRKPRHAP